MKPVLPFIVCLVLNLALLSRADTTPPTLPLLAKEVVAFKSVPLIPGEPADFRFSDDTGAANRATFVAIPGTQGLAFRAEIPVPGKRDYDVEANLKTIAAVKKGDVILARFMARAPVARQESGEGSITFKFQRGVSPWEKSVELTLTPGPEWKLFEVAFTAANDFAAGEAVIAFAFGDLAQTVEISDLAVLNFGDRARLDELPKITFTYNGREAGASWRETALKRIEEIRTAPLTIRVTDAAGKPIDGARVEAQLVQAAFLWGSSVDDQLIVAQTPDAARYRAIITEFFNTVVIENGLKWPTWLNPKRRASTIKSLEWMQQQGLRHKGHNLVWPSWEFSPRGQKNLPDLPHALPVLIAGRIKEMMALTKDNTFAWDVVNEPLHERDYFAHIPEESIADWFKLARSLSPGMKLVINEYGMLTSALSPGGIARFRDLIGRLRAAGAPIDSIGIQSHIGQQPRAPELVLADLDLIAEEKLPVQITEFDVNTTDEALQADYTRDFLIACYSHPAVEGFIMWGFWQAQHWKPDAAMFRKDWSEKPNAAVWREWVLGKWKTHLDTTTPADGLVKIRGHLGRYRVTVAFNGVTKTEEVPLTPAGAKIVVHFP